VHSERNLFLVSSVDKGPNSEKLNTHIFVRIHILIHTWISTVTANLQSISLLQRVAVCCSVLQCSFTHKYILRILSRHSCVHQYTANLNSIQNPITRNPTPNKRVPCTTRLFESSLGYPLSVFNTNSTLKGWNDLSQESSTANPKERWGAGVETHFQEI